MKIIYFHDRLLRDIYRCAQVRARLQRFLSSHKVDLILVSTHNRLQEGVKPTAFLRLDKTTVIYETQDKLPVEGVKLYEDSLVISDTVFKPVDGTIFMIDTDPELVSTAFFMDFFADERFEDFHSDLSEDQIIDLQGEIKKKTRYN
jgi:hypothetical protein